MQPITHDEPTASNVATGFKSQGPLPGSSGGGNVKSPILWPLLAALIGILAVAGIIIAAVAASPWWRAAGAVLSALTAPLFASVIGDIAPIARHARNALHIWRSKRQPHTRVTIAAHTVIEGVQEPASLIRHLEHGAGNRFKQADGGWASLDGPETITLLSSEEEGEDTLWQMRISRDMPTAQGLARHLLALGTRANELMARLPDGMSHGNTDYHIDPSTAFDLGQPRESGINIGERRISATRMTADLAQQLEDFVALNSRP